MVSPSNSLQGAMVGSQLDIQCTAEITFSGVEPNSVIFMWLGPERISIMNDSRINISPTDTSNNTYTSTLKFSYLMETDEGAYTCRVMILKTTIESTDLELSGLEG